MAVAVGSPPVATHAVTAGRVWLLRPRPCGLELAMAGAGDPSVRDNARLRRPFGPPVPENTRHAWPSFSRLAFRPAATYRFRRRLGHPGAGRDEIE